MSATVRAASATILVVEDDEPIGRGRQDVLKAEGYGVVWARTGAGALEEARNARHDLVLLDLGLPDMDGLDVCRHIREHEPEATVVILTARVTEIDVVVGLDAGADDYVTKPFRAAELTAGFLMRDARGGFYEGGHHARRLRDQEASVVIFRNGHATVAKWGRDAHFSQDVWAVRQNLALIVDHGRAVQGLRRNNHFIWGSRRSQLEYVWRSGIGIDARGQLIYIAGDKFALTTLASAFVQVGAVRAMELDIHFHEVTANLFTPRGPGPNALNATKLLPGMPRPATRYLQPDQRDFFTVTLR